MMLSVAAQLFSHSPGQVSPRGAPWAAISQKTDIAREAPRYFFREEDPVYKKIKELVCPELIDYMCLEGADETKLRELTNKKFKTLPDSLKVLEHPELDGWIFKGVDEEGKSFQNAYGSTKSNSHNHIHRVFMADKMRQVADRQHISVAHLTHDKGIAILIPDKRLVPLKSSIELKDDDFLVLSKKIDVFNDYDSHKKLSVLPLEIQQKVAEMCCKFIQSTLYMDARLGNIVLHKDFNPTPGNEKVIMVALDTEPHGALIDVSAPLPASQADPTTCALIGLETFRESCGPYLPVFAYEAEVAINKLKAKNNPEK